MGDATSPEISLKRRHSPRRQKRQAIRRALRNALQWGMPALTRKRANDQPVTWHVPHAGPRVDVICEKSGAPTSSASRRVHQTRIWIRALTFVAVLAFLRGLSPALAGDIEIKKGGRFHSGSYWYQQVVATNHTGATAVTLVIECGFFRKDVLLATGKGYAKNLLAGQEHVDVIFADAKGTDRVDCRVGALTLPDIPPVAEPPKPKPSPNYVSVEGDDGAVMKVDMNSIQRGRVGAIIYAYQDRGKPEDADKLQGYEFDCEGHYHLMGLQPSPLVYLNIPPRSMTKRISELACWAPIGTMPR
jgi:hypothetical protein